MRQESEDVSNFEAAVRDVGCAESWTVARSEVK
jgi:hypothetical protein